MVIGCAQSTDEAFSPLARNHRWFELRATASVRSSPLVRGALAAAFNDAAAAERLLRTVIRSASSSDARDDAYDLLAHHYLRTGQYERFATLYREWAVALPQSMTLRDERGNFDKYRDRPNMRSGSRRRSVVRLDADGSLPISLDGKNDHFIFDTGAFQSVVTAAEAKKLELTVQNDERVLEDSAGTRTSFRTAVAKEVRLGSMVFYDVSFGVITGGALSEVEAGIIGLPIMLAMGGVNWSSAGTAEFGAPFPASGAEPNMVFDGGRLVVRARVNGRDVLTSLDTAANNTDLNANFAEMFPELVATGQKTFADITGVGGTTQTFASVTLREVLFTIGSRTVPLRPAIVTMQRNGGIGGECCVANAGQDLLNQGQGFTLDLSRMVLQLR